MLRSSLFTIGTTLHHQRCHLHVKRNNFQFGSRKQVVRRPRPTRIDLFYGNHALHGDTIPPLLYLHLLLIIKMNNVTRRRINILHNLFRYQTKDNIPQRRRPRAPTYLTRRVHENSRHPIFRQSTPTPLRRFPYQRQGIRYPNLYEVGTTHPKRIRPMTPTKRPVPNTRKHGLHPHEPTKKGNNRISKIYIRLRDPSQMQRQPNRNTRNKPSFPRSLQTMGNRQTLPTLATRHLRRTQRTRSVITIVINRTSNVRLRRISPNTTNHHLHTLTTIGRRNVTPTFNRHNNRNAIQRKRNNHHARRYGNRRGDSSIVYQWRYAAFYTHARSTRPNVK